MHLRIFESKGNQLASGLHGPRVWGMRGQKKHSNPPNKLQLLVERGHINISTGFLKIMGVSSDRKGGRGVPGHRIIPAAPRVRSVPCMAGNREAPLDGTRDGKFSWPHFRKSQDMLTKECLSCDQFKQWMLSRKILR